MTSRVQTAPPFDTKIKRLIRKYPGVRNELNGLIEALRHDQRPGDKIPGVGYDVYKVRLGNPSAGRGKSGGFRIIYYLRRRDDVLLLTIYAKTQRQDISADEIRHIIEKFGTET